MVEIIGTNSIKDLKQNKSFSLFKRLLPELALDVLEMIKRNNIFKTDYIIVKYKDSSIWLTKEEYEV